MKTKMKRCSKSLITMLMSLLIVLSAFPLTSFGAYITDMNSNAQFGVVSGSYEKYGHEMHYAKYSGKTYLTFCCQWGVKSPDGSTYEYGSDFRTYVNNKGDTYDTIADYIAFGYTLQYGDGLPSSKSEWIAACCTQQYVWEKLGVNPTRSSWNDEYMNDTLFREWKSETEKLIDIYYNKKPSFNGSSKSINLGGNATLTDSNGVLRYYPSFSKLIGGVTFKHTKGENTLNISVADNCSTHSVSFNSASQKIYQGLPTGQNFDANTMNYVYFDFDSGNVQNLMFSNYVDPQNFRVDVRIQFGNLKITKTSEDEIIKNIPFTIKGNGKTYNVKTDANGNAELKNIPVGTYQVYEGDILRYVKQATKTVTVTDGNTANVSFKNELKKGNIKIQKNSEDKIVKDFTFKVTGSDGSSYTAKTNASGIATITGVPVYDKNNNIIVYTVKETAVPIRYVTPDGQTVTLEADKTSSVTFNNELKKGDILIQKNSEDKIVKGFTFSVKGNDGSSYTAKTDDKGIAIVKDVPVYDSNNKKIVYSVEETNVPVRYVTPDGQTVTLEPNKTSSLTFNNILKKFRVNVVKTDIEKGNAQGDAKLSGAKYGIYKGEQLIDTYTTDENAAFTTKYYVCDTDWTIREIESSEGYLVNDEIYKVGADPALYTVEYNTTANNVVEMPIKGKIAIIKHTDDGSTQIETPEQGTEFQVYLKSAGSFVNADKDEKDTIVCDEDGFASTKLLPYGIYTVHQTKGWEGREKIKDFDVFIDKDMKEYKFLINNSNFESYLKVVKLDIETGKQIAYEGAAFEIYDSNNHRISMQFTYPEVTTIHTFYTNSEGYLITPEKLPYGDYFLKEVQAPYGYVLDSTPIPFSINQENSSTDTGVTVVKVKARDIAQKGIIEITKTGEVFSSVSENNGIYTPVYKNGNLANAVFQIYAAEDIITLDGTIRAEKGELVDEITTGKDGIAKSKELYLGKYAVVEKTAPDTFVNANEQYDVELTYAGQDVKVTSTALSVFNERQKVSVSLLKELSQDERFKLGMNDEILSVQFGIYADEDITAADGSVIPKDALITYGKCDENGKLTFNCDLPIGLWYAKEMATDSHYILSDTIYEFDTYYKGQETETINISLNNGEPIINEFIYGTIKGLKIDRETEKTIEGALFGLFNSDETEFTEDKAILTALSDKDGIFTFENIPYGNWIVKELQPAKDYLPSDDIHHITVSENEEIIEITAVNDCIPELKTTATVDGEKEATAKGEITIEDVVEYKHLVPGKEYKIVGTLMDKSTGKPFEIDGKPVTSEVTFTPEKSNGTVTVSFTFDSSAIKETTELVVFEALYRDNVEIAVHADLEDEGQTVKINVPVPKNPIIPKTGDDSNIALWTALAGFSSLGIIALAASLIRKRKNNKED